MLVACMIREVEPAFLDGDVRQLPLAPRALQLLVFRDDVGLVPTVIILSEFEEDQPQNRRRVLARLQV